MDRGLVCVEVDAVSGAVGDIVVFVFVGFFGCGPGPGGFGLGFVGRGFGIVAGVVFVTGWSCVFSAVGGVRGLFVGDSAGPASGGFSVVSFADGVVVVSGAFGFVFDCGVVDAGYDVEFVDVGEVLDSAGWFFD